MSKRSWCMRENVLISFEHEYRRLILSSWCDVTGDVSSMKILFSDYLHTIVPYPMSNWGYLWKFLKSWNFQKWRNFEVLANFFVGSVTGNWVCYIDSQVHYLHFDPLIDAVAQILTELWYFQNLTYFLISWPNYLTFDLHNKWVSSDDQDIHLVQVWWWLVKRCDLYPANNLNPDRQTDRQTDKQTDKPSDEHTCQNWKILASNEKAIGDCVLAKISKMMITRNIMLTTVMIGKILKSA